MGDLFSPDSTPSTARLYEGITLLFGNPKKEFPEDFDPKRPFKAVTPEKVSRLSFVDLVKSRNGLDVVLLEKFNPGFKPMSPLDVELRDKATYVVIHPTPPTPELYECMKLFLASENGFPEDFDPERPGSEVEVVKLRSLSRQGFVSFLAGRNAEFVVTPEDYPTRDALKIVPADVELRDGATYIALPRKGKKYEQAVSSFTEIGDPESKDDMDLLIESLGYQRNCTYGQYGGDSCSPFQASGASCDTPAPSSTPGNSPNAPSAVPRRGGRFLAPVRGPAMLVRPRLVNSRVAGFKLPF